MNRVDVHVEDGAARRSGRSCARSLRFGSTGRNACRWRVALVIAFNHFSWIDPPAFGSASPRTVSFLAKIEAHRVPGLGS